MGHGFNFSVATKSSPHGQNKTRKYELKSKILVIDYLRLTVTLHQTKMPEELIDHDSLSRQTHLYQHFKMIIAMIKYLPKSHKFNICYVTPIVNRPKIFGEFHFRRVNI